ncbi:BTAD domain-containing putative transcriptional regulator [Streptomyces sp. NPDC051315]|uniref:BTAD domain-containing putative transcriptional regulator n=1 Tax=Streptomyces sp. NPDC051315 TaxID=3365650 RepID=UPI0037B49F63
MLQKAGPPRWAGFLLFPETGDGDPATGTCNRDPATGRPAPLRPCVSASWATSTSAPTTALPSTPAARAPTPCSPSSCSTRAAASPWNACPKACTAPSRPPGAANALQSQVSRLRRRLDPHTEIEAGPGGYRIGVAPDADDAHRFERLAAEGRTALAAGDHRRAAVRLREALALWRGPALPDLPDGDAEGPPARREDAHARTGREQQRGHPGRATPSRRSAACRTPRTCWPPWSRSPSWRWPRARVRPVTEKPPTDRRRPAGRS